MNMLDDLTLIQRFVQGELSLAANRSLRIEPALDTTQLLSKAGGLIASLRNAERKQAIMVREETPYWALLHQVLLENSFMPTERFDQQFMRYAFHPHPPGYELQCTEARLLWRHWWNEKRDRQNPRPNQLLFFSHAAWMPILEIAYSQGAIFVRTMTDEEILQNTDLVAWLTPHVEAEEDKTVIFAHRPAKTKTPPHLRDRPPQPTAGPAPTGQQAAVIALSTEWLSVLNIEQNTIVVQTALGKVTIHGADLQIALEREGLSSTSNGSPTTQQADSRPSHISVS